MHPISRVRRPRQAAALTYDRIACVYDQLGGGFEKPARQVGMQLLRPATGEHVLEVGPGTGHELAGIARAVGTTGLAVGLDLSRGMLRQTARRARKGGVAASVSLVQGDGVALPFRGGAFDAVFASFVLELFDTPDLLVVAGELRRVIRPEGGRAVVVSLGSRPRANWTARLYGWAHGRWPRLLDCRPIPVTQVLERAGLAVVRVQSLSLWGLAVDAVLATRGSCPPSR